jgi:hypothetical protein
LIPEINILTACFETPIWDYKADNIT